MKLTVKTSKRSAEVEVADQATVMDLKKAYQKICKVRNLIIFGLHNPPPLDSDCVGVGLVVAAQLDVHRQSFKKETDDPKKPIRLEDDKERIDTYGIRSGDVLVFKDLGPQIGYRTVFLVEYAGPLFIVLLYALRPSLIYGADAKNASFNAVAKLAVALWCVGNESFRRNPGAASLTPFLFVLGWHCCHNRTLHFLKRELETMFVHKFSRATMPLTNLFKNSIYYWSFAAVIGYPLCHPLYTAPSSAFVLIGAVIFLVSELGNLLVHIYLAKLRPAEGSKKRPIPQHPLFKLVSCPNYTFEVLSWVGFSIMTSILFSWMFTLVGFLQMADWAMKKHKGYLKMYGDEYKKLRRKAIVPFAL